MHASIWHSTMWQHSTQLMNRQNKTKQNKQSNNENIKLMIVIQWGKTHKINNFTIFRSAFIALTPWIWIYCLCAFASCWLIRYTVAPAFFSLRVIVQLLFFTIKIQVDFHAIASFKKYNDFFGFWPIVPKRLLYIRTWITIFQNRSK